MGETKNDLCFDEAKVDYQAMLATSQIAYHHCIQAISKHLADMGDITPRFRPSLSAEWLAREAGHLVIVAETMCTLKEGLSREKVTVVNKPVVKQDQD